MEEKNKNIKQLMFEAQTIINEIESYTKKYDEFTSEVTLKAKEIQKNLDDAKNYILVENQELIKKENDFKVRLEECNQIMNDLLDRAKLSGQNEDRNVINYLVVRYSELVSEYDEFVKKHRALILSSTDNTKEHFKYKAEILEEKSEKRKLEMNEFARISQSRIIEINQEIERLKK